MDFIFYEKPYVARNGTHFRVEHIYAQPRYILTSKDTQAGLAQWFKACTPVPKTAGSNPAADVLTILFLIIHGHLRSVTAEHPNVYCHW
jgi:hypothetical protein